MRYISSFLFVLGISTCLARSATSTIDDQVYYLGTPGFPEWTANAGNKPHGRELHLQFESNPNASAKTLLLQQQGVKQGWGVYLNGKRLGNLSRSNSRLEHALEIPPGRLMNGKNTLSVRAPKRIDDIRVGRFRLLDGTPAQALAAGSIEVLVSEGKESLPCRITVTHPDDTLAALTASPLPDDSPPLAVRSGVVYTGNGRAHIQLLPGKYVVYASRGFEYGVASQRINVLPGKTSTLGFDLTREVDTKGWVSVDSHIHVLDYSGHGDSSVDERMLTIAGEGLELAISTDHNRHADYAPAASRMGVTNQFTTVVGNEVTTKVGHFNAFPIEADVPIADYKQTNWARLIDGIRNTKGVQVIQLNHPRNLHSGYSPTSTNEFNLLTGGHRRHIGFDTMEVVTSAAMQSDIMALFHDWFALLNRGHRIVGVASSDTHDVSRFILGQARTYVLADDTNPARVDIDEVCRNLLRGRALISMGLIAKIRINDRHEVGDLVTGKQANLNVRVDVFGPKWTQADRIRLYANGVKIADRMIGSRPGKLKASENFSIMRLKNDAHIVAIATGPGPMKPYWETPRPYQPTSKTFAPLSIGATNPVWIDTNGDGKYESPNELARRIVKATNNNTKRLGEQLKKVDAAVILQINSVLKNSGKSLSNVQMQNSAGRLRNN